MGVVVSGRGRFHADVVGFEIKDIDRLGNVGAQFLQGGGAGMKIGQVNKDSDVPALRPVEHGRLADDG
jgi:hypothetical protein